MFIGGRSSSPIKDNAENINTCQGFCPTLYSHHVLLFFGSRFKPEEVMSYNQHGESTTTNNVLSEDIKVNLIGPGSHLCWDDRFNYFLKMYRNSSKC